MRVLSEHTLPEGIKATLFNWNGKYILKLENGFLEQTYKVSEMEVSGQKEMEELLSDSEFIKQASSIFLQMEENLQPLF